MVIHAGSLVVDSNAPAIVVWVGESYRYHFFETMISARAFLSFIPSILQTNLWSIYPSFTGKGAATDGSLAVLPVVRARARLTLGLICRPCSELLSIYNMRLKDRNSEGRNVIFFILAHRTESLVVTTIYVLSNSPTLIYSRFLCSFFSVLDTCVSQLEKWKCQSLNPVQLFLTPYSVACQAPLSMEFSRQEYRSKEPFPSPGNIPNSGIEPRSPTLQADSWSSEPRGKPVLGSLGCLNKIPYTGWLKQQKSIFLQFWRLKVYDQGVSIIRFWWMSLLACRQSLSWCFLGCRDRKRKRERAGVYSYNGINFIMRAPSHDFI